MKEFVKNIRNEKNVTLTNVQFLSNDYNNYPEEVNLNGKDTISIKEKFQDGFLISITRTIKSPNDDFFSFLVSFDIKFFFINEFEDVNYLTDEELVQVIIDEQDTLTCGCTARASMIISQLSSQLGMGVPIITPPHLIFENE